MLPILRKRNGFVLLDLFNFGLNIQLIIIAAHILGCQLSLGHISNNHEDQEEMRSASIYFFLRALRARRG